MNQVEERRHFLPITFRFLCVKDRLRDPDMQKMIWLLPRKELRRNSAVFASQLSRYTKFYDSKSEWNCDKQHRLLLSEEETQDFVRLWKLMLLQA